MKVKMLKNAKGCPDGHTLTEYAAGNVYDISDDLAACFISTQEAEEVKPAKEAKPEKKPK